MPHHLARLRLAIGTALLLPAMAWGNVGVPMLALAWPLQWLALLPIVVVECEVSRRALSLSFRRLLWPVAKANLLSTLVGIPLAWFAMLILEWIVGSAFRLVPERIEIPKYVEYAAFPFMAAWVTDNIWQIYIAFAILTVPFCLASIYIEERVLRRHLPEQPVAKIHAITRRANIISYALLLAIATGYPFIAGR